jgi:hypothetical protein
MLLVGAPFLILAAYLLSFSARGTAPAFHFTVLDYTNADSSTQALLYITNASSTAYEFFPETEATANGLWQYAAAQPEQEVIPQMFPADSAHTIRVPVPAESTRWRLRCRLWAVRNPLYWRAYHLLQDCHLASPAEPAREDRVVTSPEFRR